jgi:hypothetical protein
MEKRKELLILGLCLLVAFALRFYAFDQKSLWMDEIHTFNDSRDNLKGQLTFYRENPTYLHPPLFFILTHLFYPFPKPERDLRIIPLFFGIISIPMIYYLSKLFSSCIALPCTLSLTFMAYHISFSQDGRSYTLILFLGMLALYFFMKYLDTARRTYLFPVAGLYALLFYTNYNSILFTVFSQTLWFYGTRHEMLRTRTSSFLVLNGLTLLLCIPWILFIFLNYKGEPFVHPFHVEGTGSFLTILHRIFNDWMPYLPLTISSILLLILFPFFSKTKKDTIILLAFFILPIAGFYLFCKVSTITHFIGSKYFINFLPLFLISVFLSLRAIEVKLAVFTKPINLRLVFVVLFIASNLVMLPPYYRSGKQDFRGLVKYLKTHLQEGDNIFDWEFAYMPGVLHYFGAYPKGRHQSIPFRIDQGRGVEFKKSFVFQNKTFALYHSRTCCAQYVSEGSRLWVLAEKATARNLKENGDFILKGWFDGTYLNFRQFPDDASIYLFLYGSKSPEEKGLHISFE